MNNCIENCDLFSRPVFTLSMIRIGLGTHKIQTLFPEGTDDTFDFCTSCVEGSRDLFNQLLDSTPRGKFGNIGKH